jgi:hypothetical protein
VFVDDFVVAWPKRKFDSTNGSVATLLFTGPFFFACMSGTKGRNLDVLTSNAWGTDLACEFVAAFAARWCLVSSLESYFEMNIRT